MVPRDAGIRSERGAVRRETLGTRLSASLQSKAFKCLQNTTQKDTTQWPGMVQEPTPSDQETVPYSSTFELRNIIQMMRSLSTLTNACRAALRSFWRISNWAYNSQTFPNVNWIWKIKPKLLVKSCLNETDAYPFHCCSLVQMKDNNLFERLKSSLVKKNSLYKFIFARYMKKNRDYGLGNIVLL